MSYNLRTYSEYRDGRLGSEMQDYTLNNGAYSINILGDGYESFAQTMSENALWMCSNFYDSTAPLYPIIGQTWFDTTAGTVKVYSTDSQWVPITASAVDTDNITESIIPSISNTYVLGDPTDKYDNTILNSIYADSLTFYNIYSDVQDIYIDENGNSSLQYENNLYPSILGLNSMSDDLDLLVQEANNNTATPWTTVKRTLTIPTSPTQRFITLDPLMDRQVALYDLVGTRSGSFIIDIAGTMPTTDTQLIIRVEDSSNQIQFLRLPRGSNYNFIQGHPTDISDAASQGKTIKISFLQTEYDYEFDVILTVG